MEDYEKQQREEMKRQATRYEKFLLTGRKEWFDSDNFVDIIDWYNINDMYDKSEEVIMRAYKLFPDNDEIISRYTTLLSNKGLFEKAIAITKEALKKIDSDDLRMDLAALYIDSGIDLDKAKSILLDVKKRDDGNGFVNFLLGRIYLEKEDFVNAEKYLHKAVETNFDDKVVLGCYTDCAFDESLKETMIRLLYNLTHEHPFNDMLWTALGIVYSRYDFIQEAIEAFDYAIAIKPEGELRHACKADCYITKGDYENAKKELDIAIRYSKNNYVELHIVYAGILMQEKNYSKAIIHLREVDSRKEEITDRTYLLDMALCYYFLDNPNAAKQMVQQAINEKLAPEYIVDFARKVYDNGFQNESEDLFEMLITGDSDTYTIELASVTLAALKSREGNTFEAVKIMEQTLAELHSCTEDFWYAFLRITCQDKMYDNYTTNTLKLLMSLDSFPTYIKEHYPEIFDNPNYKRCLKKIYHV